MKRDKRKLQERLKEARKNTNLSQDDVARAVGMSQPNYCDLESGKQTGTAYIVEIADVLRVSPRWLVLGIESDTRNDISELELEVISMFRASRKMKKVVMNLLIDWKDSS